MMKFIQMMSIVDNLSLRKVETRVVAVSKSTPELLKAAVSNADPDLLR